MCENLTVLSLLPSSSPNHPSGLSRGKNNHSLSLNTTEVAATGWHPVIPEVRSGTERRQGGQLQVVMSLTLKQKGCGGEEENVMLLSRFSRVRLCETP